MVAAPTSVLHPPTVPSRLFGEWQQEQIAFAQRQQQAALATATRLQQAIWQGLQKQFAAGLDQVRAQVDARPRGEGQRGGRGEEAGSGAGVGTGGAASGTGPGWPTFPVLPALVMPAWTSASYQAWAGTASDCARTLSDYGSQLTTLAEQHAYRLQQLCETDSWLQQAWQGPAVGPSSVRF